jgi:predicted AlkP superfamily pyrophosphatase or phosphodiesterase
LRRRLRKNELLVAKLEEVVADTPLDLILINLGATDYVAHQLGPDSPQYLEAIEASDGLISRIQEMARTSNPDRAWHILVGTDHGFSSTGGPDALVVPHLEGVYEIDELVAAGVEHRIYERGGRAAELYLRDLDDAARTAAILSELPWVRRIYSDLELPGRAGSLAELRVAFPGRHGAIYVITEPAYSFAYPNVGQHGSSDPDDQHIPIWIGGPGVAERALEMRSASNADIGPTALTLLGIDPRGRLEGSGRSLVD